MKIGEAISNLNESFIAWKNDSNASNASTFLLLLVAGDCAFVFLHLLYITDVTSIGLLSLEQDRGFAEFYQYMKEFWIVVLLLVAFRKTRMIGFSLWALLFTYLLFDDALQIHERVGGMIGRFFDLSAPFGFGPKPIGELIVSATAGLTFLSLLVVPYLHGAAEYRQVSRHLFFLVLTLAFFGVFIDALHVIVPWATLNDLFGMLEDGGEMVIMSFVVWYVYLLNAVDQTTGTVSDTRHERHSGNGLHHLPV